MSCGPKLCQKAFDMIKTQLSSDLVEILPDLSKPFLLRTDASNTGLGAVLLQDHDRVKHPLHTTAITY